MQFASIAFLQISIILMQLTIVLPSLTTSGQAFGQAQMPAIGDPAFDKNSLDPEMRQWYDRLWYAIKNPVTDWPNPDSMAIRNDTYTYGRAFNDYVSGLMVAFRATGELALLQEADRLMQLMRAQLSDTNGDGYLNWIEQFDNSEDGKYIGQDIHQMNESLTHGLVAMMAYVYSENATFSPFQERADFWIDYMENHFLAKWKDRDGLEKWLLHPYVSLMRMYYYLNQITGKQEYLDNALTRQAKFDSVLTESPDVPGAHIWPHSLKNDHGWQPVNYCHNVIRDAMDLFCQGFGNFASDDFMTGFSISYRELVFTDGINSMAERIDGSGSRTFLIYDNAGLVRWDNTGRLHQIAIDAFREDRIEVPAYMLMALTTRGTTKMVRQKPTAGLLVQESDGAGSKTLAIELVASQSLSSVPTPLFFTDPNNQTTEIQMTGSTPGVSFRGTLEVTASIPEGNGLFSLPVDALVAENGERGNYLTSGAQYRIDWPPSPPSGIQVREDSD